MMKDTRQMIRVSFFEKVLKNHTTNRCFFDQYMKEGNFHPPRSGTLKTAYLRSRYENP